MQPTASNVAAPGAVGPGTQMVTAERQAPMLDGLDDSFYAEILNPLSVDFVGKVASSKPRQMPLHVVQTTQMRTITKNEEDIGRNYGLDLKNPDHPSNVHYAQTVTIPAGQTLRLPGNEAQVIIRQLVNILMDQEGNKLRKGDSFARHEYEARIVIKVGSISEFYQMQDVNVKDVINADLRSQGHEEQSFPSEDGAGGSTGAADNRASEPASQSEVRRSPGRPPKNPSA